MRLTGNIAALLCFATSAFSGSASETTARTTLDIYVVDVEGGNAVLFVAPSGESILVDTGNAGAGATRDAGRIMDAVKDAGLQQIDHLIITHWHGDHFGGLAELASRVPIREFMDHGTQIQPGDVQPREGLEAFFRETYQPLYAKAIRRVVQAGDKLQLPGLDVRIVASAGRTINTPLPGAGKPNPFCGGFKSGESNPEDPQSLGMYVRYGKFRTVHLGDLTKSKEFELMCPINRIGTVDVLLGLHHGQPSSNSEVAVHALHPRVAIMNNGTRKGGNPEVMKTVYSSPRLEDLWQLHFSVLSGQEYSAPGMFIANTTDAQEPSMPISPASAPEPGAPPAPAHNGKAWWVKVSAQKDGSFTVTNTRNGFTKAYKAAQ